MSSISYLRTTTLESHLAGDGQRFTDLIKEWAGTYFKKCHISNTEYAIDGTAFRKDGGIDGWIDAAKCTDPEGFLASKTVLQFKAGTTTKEQAEAELTRTSKDGSKRIDEYIKNGFKLVWFLGKGLAERDLKVLEDDLMAIVQKIKPGSPRPTVIDANRVSKYLSHTPSIACRLVGADGLFLTSDIALAENPHARFKKFIPGSKFASFQADIIKFFTDPSGDDPVKYIAGEPGIGKSRSVLEAVEGCPDLKGRVCYLDDPSTLKTFFAFAKQEEWIGYCIIDEYTGGSETAIPVTGDTIPRGMKAVLIGHAHLTNRKDAVVTDLFEPLSESEMTQALAATFPALEEFRIREAIKLSRQNLRLARSICDYLAKDPKANLELNGIERVVDCEIGKMKSASGSQTLSYLSMLPMLLKENLEEFCKLTQLPPKQFLQDCREMKDRSGFIQFNDHTMYVGAPAISYVMLARLWRKEPEKLTAIFAEGGIFYESILTSIKQLPPCPEKEEMLRFFKIPVANLTLPDLMDAKKGRQLLHLLVADPETYLPAVHRVIRENRGQLSGFPYERGPGPGRRDLIWKLRDLAQFEAYFEQAEEIVFWLAQEELPSAYRNDATHYWTGWFRAYFDNTTYPYAKRLLLLEQRIEEKNPISNLLIAKAIANPFPDAGGTIPSARVGGLLAPPELRFIQRSQLMLAANQVPVLIGKLLEGGTDELRKELGKQIVEACFRWLNIGAGEQYFHMVTGKDFPTESLQQLIVKVRHFVARRSLRKQDVDAEAESNIRLHERLLERIDKSDWELDILEIAEHGHFGYDESDAIYQKQLLVAERCKEYPSFLDQVMEVLSDPAKSGGGQLGLFLAPIVSVSTVHQALDKAWEKGFSQFSYALLRAFIETHPEFSEEILLEARKYELTNTRTAVSVFQSLGDKVYFQEAARLLNETSVSADFFGRFWMSVGESLTDEVREVIRAIRRRLDEDDETSKEVAINIAGEITRYKVVDDELVSFCLDVLKKVDPERSHARISDWDDIGKWLLDFQPIEVIGVAGLKEQSEFSQATTVLAEASASYPTEVLTSLAGILADPYKPPYLLSGGLLKIFQNIPTDPFIKWLETQKKSVKENVAGHLPKPYLDDGQAKVPEITRAYWNSISPDSNLFKCAMDNFFAHTFNTGVFWGHGVELFSERISIAKQLQSDSNASLRAWAEMYLLSSQDHLKDAERRQALDEAMKDNYD